MNNANHNLSAIAQDVARALTHVSVKGGSAFISTPLLYPSGSHAVIRIDGTGDRWFVSDDGSAHLEAELMGGLASFRRIATHPPWRHRHIWQPLDPVVKDYRRLRKTGPKRLLCQLLRVATNPRQGS